MLNQKLLVQESYEAVDVYLEQPESKIIIRNLQQEGRNIRDGLRSLPDIDDFLCQLTYLPSGNLKCQRLACHKSDGFEPSYSGILAHFRVFHCTNFEGASRAYIYNEIHRRVDLQLQRQKTWDMIAYILSQNPSKIQGSSTAHSLEGHKPSWEQLRVLRTLRAKFIVHHRQFLQRAANSPSSGLQELRNSCRRYADLLDTGLLTFNAIMNNESPSSLKEVFAFMSLSYAISEKMQANGKSVSFCPSRSEMYHWRNSLPTEKERRTFDELVSLM
jgi:hypothetical protein